LRLIYTMKGNMFPFRNRASEVRNSDDLVRQVQSGKLSRRDLLRAFGVSAAAIVLEPLSSAFKSQTYDYVIIGAGSAGCALTGRLLADSSARILLIEAGGSNGQEEIKDFTQSYRLTMPGSKVDWAFKSEPQRAMLNRTLSYSCGRVLGGSSSINGMVWVHGNRADYDNWATTGCAGWDYAAVHPSFAALDSLMRPSSELTSRNALSKGIIQAAVGLGFPFNSNYNGEDQLGVAFTQLNVANGMRRDAFTTCLTPYLGSSRLTIMTDAPVKRLVFDQSKTIDKVIIDVKGQELAVRANREVIVCTGTINTAHLLQLSGIGAAADIEPHGINLVTDLPGVGKNLQDHLISVVAKKLRRPEPASHTTSMDINVFTGSGSPKGSPKFEVQSYYIRYGWESYPAESLALGIVNLHPSSRGFVKLRSSDFRTPPLIQPNFLETSDDLANHIEGYELVRSLLNSPSLRGWVIDEEVVPGPHVSTSEQIVTAIRQYSEANFHPVGTCKMGTDNMAVVDPQLRVHGVKGLRLASAAIMPAITSGNTNAPSMMIGDRCGRLLLST
jgi:choline dehydrogenase